ncbi:MAG: HIT family protein [Bacteroidota bacterium]
MASIFSRIVTGEIPCYKVAETGNCLAFLDLNPLSKGHTLIVPKKEIDYIFDIEDDLYTEMFLFAKKVAKAIDIVEPSLKVGVAIIGLEVRHAHIHLVPQHSAGTLNFKNEKLELNSEELKLIANRINESYQLI